jgi:hypothetical protein
MTSPIDESHTTSPVPHEHPTRTAHTSVLRAHTTSPVPHEHPTHAPPVPR